MLTESRNKQDEVRYWYTCQAEAVYSSFVRNEEEIAAFTNLFKTKNESHHLDKIYKANLDGPFEESSVSAYKLICAYLWITK